MPRYSYQCALCDEFFEISHGMKEDAPPCDCGEILTRVPSIPLDLKVKTTEKELGMW